MHTPAHLKHVHVVFAVAAVSVALTFAASSCQHEIDGAPLAVDDAAPQQGELTVEERRFVAEVIRGVAASKGITNSVVVAGVAQHETNLVHCFSDAPFHCAGPQSESCGGAVLAGSGDGPCHIRQGGLGMFQLDSGTHQQTLRAHGHDILSLEGNVARGIDIIVEKVEICPNTPLFSSTDEAIAWINSAVPGTFAFDVFHHAMSACYNGCSVAVCGVALHNQRAAQYASATLRMLDELGEEFWSATQIADEIEDEIEDEVDDEIDLDDEIDAATMTCGDFASAMGFAVPACEWNGNGACGARGPATLDCDACCDWSALPFTPTDPSTMSCGEYANHVGFVNAQCEWNGNGACGGKGAKTWDCDACCDRP